MIIITNHLLEQALHYYKQRWQTETLFGSLKSREFNFEETPLTHAEQLSKLMALLRLPLAGHIGLENGGST